MVTDEQVRVVYDGLVGDGGDRVDGQQDPAYVDGRVTENQPDGVPGVGMLPREPLVEQFGDLTQRRHGRPTGTRARVGR